jgi:predicted peptidase
MTRNIMALVFASVCGMCSLGVTHAEQLAARSNASIKNDLNYLMYTPDDYASSGSAYPLVVWLHGGDQGGTDIEKVKSSGIPKLVEDGKTFPFLVFSPQNQSEELLYPIEKVEAALMAEQFPEKFAAVVPIAGGGNRHYLSRTNENAAFWVFHGTNDEVIPLSDSVVLYERLVGLKRNARLSVLEGVDHSAVEWAALNDPELWDWLLKQRLDVGPE